MKQRKRSSDGPEGVSFISNNPIFQGRVGINHDGVWATSSQLYCLFEFTFCVLEEREEHEREKRVGLSLFSLSLFFFFSFFLFILFSFLFSSFFLSLWRTYKRKSNQQSSQKLEERELIHQGGSSTTGLPLRETQTLFSFLLLVCGVW